MRHGHTVGHGMRNNILAKIMAGMRVFDVARQFGIKILGVENIDAHAAHGHIGSSRDSRWIRRLLDEVRDQTAPVDRHDPKATRFLARHLNTRNSALGTAFDVVNQHQCIIHLVDVVARKNHDEIRRRPVSLENVDVLVNGIGSAPIPGFLVDTLLCRE